MLCMRCECCIPSLWDMSQRTLICALENVELGLGLGRRTMWHAVNTACSLWVLRPFSSGQVSKKILFSPNWGYYINESKVWGCGGGGLSNQLLLPPLPNNCGVWGFVHRLLLIELLESKRGQGVGLGRAVHPTKSSCPSPPGECGWWGSSSVSSSSVYRNQNEARAWGCGRRFLTNSSCHAPPAECGVLGVIYHLLLLGIS